MTDDDKWKIAANIHAREMSAWKIVEFQYNNMYAVRETGETHIFRDRYECETFIRVQAAKATAAYCHREQLTPAPT